MSQLTLLTHEWWTLYFGSLFLKLCITTSVSMAVMNPNNTAQPRDTELNSLHVSFGKLWGRTSNNRPSVPEISTAKWIFLIAVTDVYKYGIGCVCFNCFLHAYYLSFLELESWNQTHCCTAQKLMPSVGKKNLVPQLFPGSMIRTDARRAIAGVGNSFV